MDSKRAAEALVGIRTEFAMVEERLADGRPYLLGDRFPGADLAFACMAAPTLLVQRHEGHGGSLPAMDQVPLEYAQLVKEFRATTAGQSALRMFAQECRKVPSPSLRK